MPAFQKLSERTEKDKHCSVHSNSRITLIVHRATMRKMVQSRVSTRKFCIILHLKYLLDHRQSSINSLRYADDTTLKAESEEELKSLLMRLKRQSEKPGLKFNIFKTKTMASGPISSWQIKGEEVEAVTDFTFLGSKINVEGDYSHEIKRCFLLGRKAMTKLVQFSSVTQSCLTLCDPMNRSTPGIPVHQQLPEFTQTHVHRVDDAIQPSHPLSSPSPPAPNPSQHQGLFQ